jgi:hypothetical protein
METLKLVFLQIMQQKSSWFREKSAIKKWALNERKMFNRLLAKMIKMQNEHKKG